MSFSTLRDEVETGMKFYRLAEPRAARRQSVRLIKAKAWMNDRGINATAIGSKFEYKVATGAVLGVQK